MCGEGRGGKEKEESEEGEGNDGEGGGGKEGRYSYKRSDESQESWFRVIKAQAEHLNRKD